MSLGFYGQADRKLIERCATALEAIEADIVALKSSVDAVGRAIANGNALLGTQQEKTNELLQQILDVLKSEQTTGRPVTLKFEFGTAVNK